MTPSMRRLDVNASGGTDAVIASPDLDRVDASNSKPSSTSFPPSCSPTHADLGSDFIDAEPGAGGEGQMQRDYMGQPAVRDG
jgi:hypothetical protein